MSQNAAALRIALQQMNLPYLYGGKGELAFDVTTGRVKASPYLGFDCSGLVTFAAYAAGGPDLRFRANTDALWRDLRETDLPQPGCLAFYGGKSKDDVDHVMIVLNRLPTGEVMVFGASGGRSTTFTLEEARRLDARVKVFERHNYRQDFRGFRCGILQS